MANDNILEKRLRDEYWQCIDVQKALRNLEDITIEWGFATQVDEMLDVIDSRIERLAIQLEAFDGTEQIDST